MKNKENIYVIIGNGIAAMSAAEEIRKADADGIIKMVTEENYLTYYRIKLSHFISKDPELKGLLIHDGDWYKERNIEVFLNSKVKEIKVETSKIILDNGEEISYNKLLIANGSQSFIPPVEGVTKEGVYALRSMKDLIEIQDYVKDCKEVSVIGGGLLGLEAAWALKERGLKVNVIEFAPFLLPRQLDEELADYIKEKLEENGLRIHLSGATDKITGDDGVKGVLLKDGRNIPSDMVLFSTGVRPNIKIVDGTDIKSNKGIIVDSYMKTTGHNIFAAGDIAELDGIVMGLWPVAMDQGKIAGKNMTGSEESYSLPQPATMLSIGNISLFSVGEINKDKDTVTFKEGQVFHKLFIDNGKLIGGVLTGDVKKMAKLKGAVGKKADIEDLLKNGMNVLEILNNL